MRCSLLTAIFLVIGIPLAAEETKVTGKEVCEHLEWFGSNSQGAKLECKYKQTPSKDGYIYSLEFESPEKADWDMTWKMLYVPLILQSRYCCGKYGFHG